MEAFFSMFGDRGGGAIIKSGAGVHSQKVFTLFI